jgi:hypothetical protein
MSYIEKFNRDDIHARAIIVGLINLLNQEIFFINTVDNETQEIVEVPFYYSFTGDERYLQDHFLEWRDCTHPKFMNGNFDPIPRGVAKMSGMSIQQSNMTQRWIRGNFTRIVDGRIETFSSYINSLPLEMTFELEVRTGTMTDMLKIVQAIWEVFYKVQIFHVSYKGVMIPCQAGFPEEIAMEKAFEFAYPSETKISGTFSLNVETYFPIFDEPNLGSNAAVANVNKMNEWIIGNVPQGGIDLLGNGDKYKRTQMNDSSSYYVGDSRRDRVQIKRGTDRLTIHDNGSMSGKSIRKASNKMEELLVGSFDMPGNINKPIITFTSPIIGNTYDSNLPIKITWQSTNYIHKVDIYYSIDFGETWNMIERFVPANIGEYDWIGSLIVSSQDVIVNSSSGKGSGAAIRALIDANGTVYQIVIDNPGNDYDQTAVLEIESSTGSGAELIASVVDGHIVDAVILSGGSGYSISKSEEVSFRIVSSTGSASAILTDSDGNIGTILVK